VNVTIGTSGDGCPPSLADTLPIVGVAVDSAGNIYIADSNNSVIRKVDAITGNISTVAGNGTYGYSGDGGPPTSATMSYPPGAALDSAGNIYIADTNNSVIRKVDAVGCSFMVIVNDTEPPSTTCPTNLTVSCASAVPVPDTNTVSASDNCTNVTVSFEGDVISDQTCSN